MLAGFGLLDALDEHAGQHPHGLALVCGIHRITWAELRGRVTRLAGAMEATGIGAGARVLWAGQNCHRLLETLLAAEWLGATLCPLNWRQSSDELRFVLADADPTLVVWQQEEIGPVVQLARDATASASTIWVAHDDDGPDGYEAWLTGARAAAVERVADASAPLLMLYTAAFDGRPAASMLPSRSLLLQAVYGRLFAGVSADDVYLNAGPLFHVGTLKTTVATFVAGGTNVFVPRADAGELCRIIDAERCTGAFLQPPTMAAMVEANRDGRFDLSSLRDKPRYRSGYGQTELGGAVSFVDDTRRCEGAAGRPGLLTRLEIVDGDDNPLPVGAVGEIVVRGPAVHCGYHRRPDLTAQRQRGGWHHTGDLGRREADGSFTFVGPMAGLIKSAAENIYPAEVEACLRSHPDIADAAVIGVPDPTWGQSVRAVLVAADGRQPGLEELQAHCRDHIASYKKPRSAVFTDRLPRRGATLDRDAIDAQFGGGGYPGEPTASV